MPGCLEPRAGALQREDGFPTSVCSLGGLRPDWATRITVHEASLPPPQMSANTEVMVGSSLVFPRDTATVGCQVRTVMDSTVHTA